MSKMSGSECGKSFIARLSKHIQLAMQGLPRSLGDFDYQQFAYQDALQLQAIGFQEARIRNHVGRTTTNKYNLLYSFLRCTMGRQDQGLSQLHSKHLQ